MKLLHVSIVSFLLLYPFCNCKDDDDSVAKTIDDQDEMFDHQIFDQDILAGGSEQRRKLTDMSKEDVEKEIRKLIQKIDTNSDGDLDKEELHNWLLKVEQNAMNREIAMVFKKEDTNGDGHVTFKEYMTNSGNPEDYTTDKEAMEPVHRNLYEKFKTADQDKDGQLTSTEFGFFIYPDRNPEMMDHLVRDQLLRLDGDKDGKISRKEYIRNFVPDDTKREDMPEWMIHEEEEFDERLDQNHDGYLDRAEIQEWLKSDDMEYVNEEVEHLFNDIDENKDDKLSTDEVLDRFEVLVDSSITDYGHTVHEEL